MKLIVNGQEQSFDAPLSIAALLAARSGAQGPVAIALNGGFVPREHHAATILKDGDQVEIVAPMQGG